MNESDWEQSVRAEAWRKGLLTEDPVPMPLDSDFNYISKEEILNEN